jgi:hypothetical protein
MKLKDLDIPDEIRQYGDCQMKSGDQTIMRFYLDRIAAGMSPRFAETLAMQEPPGIGITTSVFLQDQRRWGNSILDQHGGNELEVLGLKADLAKHGYKLKADDQYIKTAAEFRGDPRAIVNETQSFSDLEKGIKERQKRRAEEPAKIKRKLAPKIVERIRQQKIKSNPDLARKDQGELRHEIISKHGTKAEVL